VRGLRKKLRRTSTNFLSLSFILCPSGKLCLIIQFARNLPRWSRNLVCQNFRTSRASLGRAISQTNRRAVDQLRHHFRYRYNDMIHQGRNTRPHLSASALLRFHSSPTLVTKLTSWIGSQCWSVTARRADIRARVNAQIRDCNKTTDVRTADSRTGIAPTSPLALLSRILPRSFPLYFFSFALSRSLISPTSLYSPFTSQISLCFSFLFWLFLLQNKRTEWIHVSSEKLEASRRD